MYITHLFIHSSVDGHLGCFHLLAILNNAIMNAGIHVSVQVPAFNSFGSGTAKSYGKPMLSFRRIDKLFSIAVAPFYIATSCAQVLGGLTI